MSVCCPLLRVSVSFPHHWVPGNQLTYPIVTENPIGIGLRGLLVEPETLDTRRGFPHTRAVPLFGPNITGQFGRFWRSETQVARSMVSLTTSFPTRYCPRKSLGSWSSDFSLQPFSLERRRVPNGQAHVCQSLIISVLTLICHPFPVPEDWSWRCLSTQPIHRSSPAIRRGKKERILIS